ncbi:hypothetical protein [Pedobacter faecalis]|uniref:hypothetical protein n=1 Tax=Pedobacter faecalis TaxID=3041495 RepID=UPI00254AB31C|nr:hypothetical protein [Pedobacter sp. ELA7]
MKNGFFGTLAAIVLIAFSAPMATAQKVTELQEVGIVAPPAMKIDGKNFEWKDADFTVNKRTTLSYIISNDDKNLYLIVKSTDAMNNNKILAGGITFSVNPDGKKKEKESISLTYPLINRSNMRGPGGAGMRRMGAAMGMGGGAIPSQKERDSMMAAMQRTQLAQAKEIKLNGFKKTTDTLVSIYNAEGIKAFASIDKENVFFYEAAIPLEELGMSAGNTKEFVYNIKVNGLQLAGFDGPGGGGGRGNVVVMGSPRGGGGFGGARGGGFDFQEFTSPTDFWGKYTLLQK